MEFTRRHFLRMCGISTLALVSGPLAACSQQDDLDLEEIHTISDVARALVEKMSLEEKVAQLFIITPEQLTGAGSVQQASQVDAKALQLAVPCGVIFFGSNLVSPTQTKELLQAVQNAALQNSRLPLMLCVDEEGGPVQRIGGTEGFDAPSVASMSEVGATNDVTKAEEAARTIANSTKNLGFNTDFAPSCDVATSDSSAMKTRSFGADPELVSRMVAAQIRTFEEEGVICCAKHFPGIGDPVEDSHDLSIYTDKRKEELFMQLMPFKAAIEAGVPLVMMGHLSMPEVTGNDIPASISADAVQGLLRDELGYEGVVITDSLSMGALRGFCSEEDLGLAAIEAGCDIALMPPDLPAAYNGLLNAVQSGRVTQERIDASLERIVTLKLKALSTQFSDAIQKELASVSEA